MTARILTLLLLAALGACDSGTTPEAPPEEGPPETLPVGSIRLETSDSVIGPGGYHQVTTALLSARGTPLNWRAVEWSSSDTTVAVVSNSGGVSGRREGSVVISARSEGKTGTLPMTVRGGWCYLSLVEKVGVGVSRAGVIYTSKPGGYVPVNPVVTSSNPAVATVSSEGVVTGKSVGTTTFTVSCDGVAPTRRQFEVVALTYAATFLGTLGGQASVPFDINQRGEVVGEARTATGAMHAFRWHEGRMTDLGTPGVRSRALGISENGLIAGSYTDRSDDSGHRPFLWREGVVTRLDPAPEEESVVATAVNSAGTVVGYSETRSADVLVGSALLWSGGVRTDLGRMDGYRARLVRIDDAGRILANVVAQNSVSGSVLLLGEARTPVPFRATGLASNGLVSGEGRWSSDAGVISYLWENGGVQEFSVGRHNGVHATDINRSGLVVGDEYRFNERSYAFVWDRKKLIRLEDVTADLPAGWRLTSATGINDDGQIIGVASHSPSGRTEAVLLTPAR